MAPEGGGGGAASGRSPEAAPGTVEIPAPTLRRVSRICLGLPEVSVRVDPSLHPARSTAHSFDVRRRSFCLLVAWLGRAGDPVPLLLLRADPQERRALLSGGGPYFAGRGGPDRIGVRLSEGSDWEEIRELVTESYLRVAPGKLRALLDRPGTS